MKTQDHPVLPKMISPDTGHIHFLERQQRYLESLKARLNSYHCVPRTALQYEMIEGLRMSLAGLYKENELLITSLSKNRTSAKQHFYQCEGQFAKMMELEYMVLDYIRETTR